MKNIKSNSIMESFGMKEMDVEELMQISGGEEESCGVWIGCRVKCTCNGSTYITCPSKRILECTSWGMAL